MFSAETRQPPWDFSVHFPSPHSQQLSFAILSPPCTQTALAPVPEKEGVERIFEERMAENFLNLMKQPGSSMNSK